ncbi:hypothetical protein FLAG1_01185 [Fusarium langsethiae]|uniref:Uncharacterized protein n=1 Tax=Fusarium langsethiae TaxID=179993 RepID=A0A0N0DHR2_FUSLA|nr:hypothetical protein FLAG1_01185 [Fusarium langsethiae]GKT99126.1 unnamed protein product [Fusarium langsethiae]GKU17469.1 unnamed protein product [Fusarium langsethiae]
MSSERMKVEIEAEDVPKESVVSDTQFSISSLLRQQRQQALDTLNSLEPQQKQLELSHEREMEDLKRENQRLRSENQALHSQIESSRSESVKPTASSAPPLDTLDTNTEALSNSTTRQFEHIAKYALDLDITDNTTKEIGALCQVLYDQSCWDNLKSFMTAQADGPKIYHCLRRISIGDTMTSVSASSTAVRCHWCQNMGLDCVWIFRKMGKWVIGSGTPPYY